MLDVRNLYAGHTWKWSTGGGYFSARKGAPYMFSLGQNKLVAATRKGGTWSAAEEAEFKRPTIEMIEHQSHPLYASARLWDDGIVDPRKTREVLALSLMAALNAPVEETRFGVFRM